MKIREFEIGAVYQIKNRAFFDVLFFIIKNDMPTPISVNPECSKYRIDSMLYLGSVSSKDIMSVNSKIGEICYKFLTNGEYVYSFATSWFDPLDYEDIKKASGPSHHV